MSNPTDAGNAGAPPANPSPPGSPAPGADPSNPAAVTAPAGAGTPPGSAPGAGTPPDGGTSPAGDKPADKGPWGDNWRENAAGEDGETLNRLRRYASPKDVAKALREAQDKIRSGELAAPLPENATEEQVKEYRQRNGVPESPAGYLEKLPDGLVIGEDDKPLFEAFAGELHKHHMKPEVAQGILKWYQDLVQAEDHARVEADGALKTETEKALREEWGGDYRINVNVVNAMLAQAPQDVQDMLAEARTPDGTPIKGTAAFARWLAALAREVNPVVTLSGGRTGDPMQSMHDEIAGIEKLMQTNPKDYYGNPKHSERLAELYRMRESMAQRKSG